MATSCQPWKRIFSRCKQKSQCLSFSKTPSVFLFPFTAQFFSPTSPSIQRENVSHLAHKTSPTSVCHCGWRVYIWWFTYFIPVLFFFIGVGDFSVWEFSGNPVYFCSYDYFAANDPTAIHIVLFSLEEPYEIQLNQVTFWLSFLKSLVPVEEPIGMLHSVFIHVKWGGKKNLILDSSVKSTQWVLSCLCSSVSYYIQLLNTILLLR